MRPPTPLHEILEDAWDAQLFRGRNAIATTLGWTTYHTLRSKGSKSGYPDRTLVRDRLIFAELKRELTGKKSEDANRQPSDSQIEWLDRLAAAGAEVYLWRPSDLEEIADILARRGLAFEHYHDTQPAALYDGASNWWTPRSLWIPGVGRADTTEQQNLLAKGAA